MANMRVIMMMRVMIGDSDYYMVVLVMKVTALAALVGEYHDRNNIGIAIVLPQFCCFLLWD